ncbi:UNVERIFIED_CONTAM: Histidine--tRNA ligase, partial [Eudyptes robustus]
KVKEQKARAEKMKAEGKFALKTPKGTKDFGSSQMVVREKVLGIMTEIFKKHGAEAIDTPVFELKEVLMGKYGEEGGKLVYDLADQGGEACSLRYDLTVPFARYVAMNKLANLKRYHIAKVYRRDNPVMTKGRFREFYQCDFDIAGQYDSMLPDAECLKIADEVLSTLDLGEFEIRLNHRALLEGIFALSGIDTKDFKTVCSSVDKLDKVPWETVRDELVNEKKIPADAVNHLEKYVRARELASNPTNEDLLKIFETFENERVKVAVNELRLLLEYCELYGCNKRVVFEPSLARGLDYYTGVIYEVIVKEFSFVPKNANPENPEENCSVGSVAAGGRYDTLVGMFSASAGKKRTDVPCVGISFGIERLFSIMEMKHKSEETGLRTNATDVLVASAQKGLLKERMKIARLLWDANIRTELPYKANPKLLNQLQYAEERIIPWVVLLGEQELNNGLVKIRNVKTREETEVKIDDLVEELKKRLS